jgi:phosphoenolpyruvate carboxylase
VNRKTLLRKYRAITDTLGVLDRSDLLPYERTVHLDNLYREIASTWGSDEIRRSKPTPQMEAAGGNAVVETVLWDAVPSYLRKLNAQCQISLGKSLPVDVVPIKFASWIGGDRDGNPNVTPEVTAEVLLAQRLRAAKLLLNDMNVLYNELAISSQHSSFSPEMEELAETVKKSHDKYEKYRRVIGHLKLRLLKTVRQLEKELPNVALTVETVDVVTDDWDEIQPITKKDDLMKPLKIMHDSLVSTGYASLADGHLVDTIRRLAVFGINLVPLDIREESTLHTMAIDAITQYLGIGSYVSWNEDARLNFLKTELSNRRPLFKLDELIETGIDERVLTTLRTFETISSFDPESLGAYVISQATSASDVLAVMLLQKQFGMTPENGKMMRVVPLFETLDDLQNASNILERLFKISQFVGAVKGKMEVMVGYSDSAKDAGRLAACWAQYTSQEKMVKVASDYNIELTFFHGKGGTVGRGGNPALYRAVLSHPPKTINGRFRVTEQGEMIRQNFGSADIAERTLDIYTAAVLREQFVKHVEPTESWRCQMDRISEVSCADYRQLVREEPLFVPYFRQATPELELSILNIGSRPAKRNPKGKKYFLMG